MSAKPLSALTPLLNKLQGLVAFDWADRTALLALPYKPRQLRASEYIVHDGDRADCACVLLSGFAVRHKVAGDGGRQILSLHMVGDLVDLQNSLLHVADHNVQALTNIDAAYIPVEAIAELAAEYPAIGRAMWRETLIEASILREWALNIGRRDARTRTAHFLCELAVRLEAAGLTASEHFNLPCSQEQMADMLGLTSVHLNRTLHALSADGLIRRSQRSVVIPERERLASAGDFDPGYLHLPSHKSTQAVVAEHSGSEVGRGQEWYR